jgi:hypothetical protein
VALYLIKMKRFYLVLVLVLLLVVKLEVEDADKKNTIYAFYICTKICNVIFKRFFSIKKSVIIEELYPKIKDKVK